MSWDAFPWAVEATGLVILVVWTVIPLREFRDIFSRLRTDREAAAAQPAELEEVGV